MVEQHYLSLSFIFNTDVKQSQTSKNHVSETARDLAYYTNIVREAFDGCGELRAIMGGGRYDRLLELHGGEKLAVMDDSPVQKMNPARQRT